MQINNRVLFPSSASFQSINQLQDSFSQLQGQLATGKRANSLSDLAGDTNLSLTLRARLSKLDSYQSNITTVNLRLDMFSHSLSGLQKIEADSRSAALVASSSADGLTMIGAQSLSRSRLDEALSIMNTDINGRYMFGGKATDTPPVEPTDTLLNGDGVRAGFADIAAQRKLADAGANNMGRLVLDSAAMTSTINGGSPNIVTLADADTTLHPQAWSLTGAVTDSAGYIAVTAPSGTPAQTSVTFDSGVAAPVAGEKVTVTVTLPDGSTVDHVFTAVAGAPANANEFTIGATQDDTATNFKAALDAVMTPQQLTIGEDGGVAHPFGLKLNSVTSSGSAFTVSAPAGSPAVMSVQATGSPAPGDTLKFSFQMPGGTNKTITLTATSGAPGDGEFAIGSTPAATLANVQTALTGQIQQVVKTDVATLSIYAAADDFFNGQGQAVKRVGGPDYATATTLVNASAADTVFWYHGADDADPRSAVSARIDDASKVDYGVQANESGTLGLVRSLAALAVDQFSNSDSTSVARYNVARNQQVARLSPAHNSQAGSIEVITLQLGTAQVSAGHAADRHTTYNAQLKTMLDSLETAPVDEVATKLLQLQTRLQASYQVMGIVSQLTLANYVK